MDQCNLFIKCVCHKHTNVNKNKLQRFCCSIIYIYQLEPELSQTTTSKVQFSQRIIPREIRALCIWDFLLPVNDRSSNIVGAVETRNSCAIMRRLKCFTNDHVQISGARTTGPRVYFVQRGLLMWLGEAMTVRLTNGNAVISWAI